MRFFNISKIYENNRSSRPKVFLVKGALKIRSKFTQKIRRRTPMPKCDFNKVALQYKSKEVIRDRNVLFFFHVMKIASQMTDDRRKKVRSHVSVTF